MLGNDTVIVSQLWSKISGPCPSCPHAKSISTGISRCNFRGFLIEGVYPLNATLLSWIQYPACFDRCAAKRQRILSGRSDQKPKSTKKKMNLTIISIWKLRIWKGRDLPHLNFWTVKSFLGIENKYHEMLNHYRWSPNCIYNNRVSKIFHSNQISKF